MGRFSNQESALFLNFKIHCAQLWCRCNISLEREVCLIMTWIRIWYDFNNDIIKTCSLMILILKWYNQGTVFKNIKVLCYEWWLQVVFGGLFLYICTLIINKLYTIIKSLVLPLLIIIEESIMSEFKFRGGLPAIQRRPKKNQSLFCWFFGFEAKPFYGISSFQITSIYWRFRWRRGST